MMDFTKGFFRSRAGLLREMSALRELNKDLNQQVQDGLKRQAITPAELEEITRIRKEHAALLKEQAEIIVYMRNNFAAEMARGDHGGMTLAQIVTMYMGRAKMMREPLQ
jgi:hypothetical protein